MRESNDYGHSWITLEDNNGNKTSFGFWPATIARKEAVFGKKYKGTLSEVKGESDIGGYKPDQTMSYEINKADYDKVMNYAAEIKNNPPDWSLENNCTDFVVMAASMANIFISDIKTYKWSDPNKLADKIKKNKK